MIKEPRQMKTCTNKTWNKATNNKEKVTCCCNLGTHMKSKSIPTLSPSHPKNSNQKPPHPISKAMLDLNKFDPIYAFFL
jgi:hypothetical protein